MVRFSDMLGGNADAEGGRAATMPDAVAPFATDDTDESELDALRELTPAGETDADGITEAESPQEVLDRLTQYATARGVDQAPAPPESEPVPEPAGVVEAAAPEAAAPELAPADELATMSEDLRALGDDLLPHPKSTDRKSNRRTKRRP